MGWIEIKRERYSIKTTSGRYVKVKQSVLYGVTAPHGFYMCFQEHPPGGEGKTHTHVWIENETYPDLVPELQSFISQIFEYYPKKLIVFALMWSWNLNDEETEFEGPYPVYEFVVARKLSRTLINHVCDWLDDVLFHFMPRMGMIGLFGGLDSE